MGTDITKLKVSLTKHGAHKIAYLIAEFDKDDILNHLDGDFNEIHIDYAQTTNILSIDKNGTVPDIWNQVKLFGIQDIYDLVFFAIVFSHHSLIDTMIDGISKDCRIERGRIIDGKAYTNFAHIIDELGLSIEHTESYVTFDLSRIFYKFYLSKFATKLFALKLTEAGWDQKNNLTEEALSFNFTRQLGFLAKSLEHG